MRQLFGTPKHGHNMTSGHFGHFTANHNGAFMDPVTHELMVTLSTKNMPVHTALTSQVKSGDHYDTVLSPHQTSEIFMGLVLVIILAQIGLHWWKKNRC